MSGRISLASDRQGAPGNTGSTGPTGSGAAGLFRPSKAGLVAANFDPALCATNATLVGGVLFLQRVELAVDTTISSIKLLTRTPAAAGVTNAFVGLYSITGTLLAQSADVSTAMQSGSPATHALTVPLTGQTAGTEYYVAILIGSATTYPTMQGSAGSFLNSFLSGGANFRSGTLSSGLTALPSTITPSSISSGVGIFAGLG